MMAPMADEVKAALIKHMADRFLGWRLPENFSPDAGISFKRTFNEHTAHPMKSEPTGTNLFDAEQATAMVRYMLDGFDPTPAKDGITPAQDLETRLRAADSAFRDTLDGKGAAPSPETGGPDLVPLDVFNEAERTHMAVVRVAAATAATATGRTATAAEVEQACETYSDLTGTSEYGPMEATLNAVFALAAAPAAPSPETGWRRQFCDWVNNTWGRNQPDRVLAGTTVTVGQLFELAAMLLQTAPVADGQ